MVLISPQSRFRINSKSADYFKSIFQLVSGSYKKGSACEKLENQISERYGAGYAVAMPQARVGIYHAVLASVEPGKEIILSPNTIADVINMVICAGAIPVFCDIDISTGNLDPNLIEELITPETAAILVTHLYGLMAPMEELKRISEKYRLVLIEDAAQAFGARQNGKYSGTVGDIGIYSFGMAKNVMSFYGGMLVTKNKEIENAVRKSIGGYPLMNKRKFRNKILACLIKDIATVDYVFALGVFKFIRYGYRKKIKFIINLIEAELDLSRKSELPVSYRERMTPLQARLILSKLENVDSDYRHRLACAKIYHEKLKDIPDLKLPPMLDDCSHVYNYYPVGYRENTTLQLYLMEQSRDVAIQHMKNTAELQAFKDFSRSCPNAAMWSRQILMLPNYPKYRLSEVEKTAITIRNYFEK